MWSASISSVSLFCSQKSLCTSTYTIEQRGMLKTLAVCQMMWGSKLALNCSIVWTLSDPNPRAFQQEEICKVDLTEYYF